jgi:hypothetical protein
MRVVLGMMLLMIPLAVGCGGDDEKGDSGYTSILRGDGSEGEGEGEGEGEDERNEGSEPGDCTDRADNDGDGLFDCDDDGCAGSDACEVTNTNTNTKSVPSTDLSGWADTYCVWFEDCLPSHFVGQYATLADCVASKEADEEGRCQGPTYDEYVTCLGEITLDCEPLSRCADFISEAIVDCDAG